MRHEISEQNAFELKRIRKREKSSSGDAEMNESSTKRLRRGEQEENPPLLQQQTTTTQQDDNYGSAMDTKDGANIETEEGVSPNYEDSNEEDEERVKILSSESSRMNDANDDSEFSSRDKDVGDEDIDEGCSFPCSSVSVLETDNNDGTMQSCCDNDNDAFVMMNDKEKSTTTTSGIMEDEMNEGQIESSIAGVARTTGKMIAVLRVRISCLHNQHGLLCLFCLFICFFVSFFVCLLVCLFNCFFVCLSVHFSANIVLRLFLSEEGKKQIDNIDGSTTTTTIPPPVVMLSSRQADQSTAVVVKRRLLPPGFPLSLRANQNDKNNQHEGIVGG